MCSSYSLHLRHASPPQRRKHAARRPHNPLSFRLQAEKRATASKPTKRWLPISSPIPEPRTWSRTAYTKRLKKSEPNAAVVVPTNRALSQRTPTPQNAEETRPTAYKRGSNVWEARCVVSRGERSHMLSMAGLRGDRRIARKGS